MATTLEYLTKIQKRFDEAHIKESFAGYSRVFQFQFTDSNEKFFLTINNGDSADLEAGEAESPDLTVILTSAILSGIMERKINPMTAYSTRKVMAKGAMEDLMRLQRLL